MVFMVLFVLSLVILRCLSSDNQQPPWFAYNTVCIIDKRFEIVKMDKDKATYYIIEDWKPYHESENKEAYSSFNNRWEITSWKIYDEWIYVKFNELEKYKKEYTNSDGTATVEEVQFKPLWSNGLNMYGRFNRKTDERIYYKDINSIEDNAIRNRFKHLK